MVCVEPLSLKRNQIGPPLAHLRDIMELTIPMLFSMVAVIRLISILISASNEIKLKKQNAVEYGKRNSKILLLCHSLFYLSCLSESILNHRQVNDYSFFGLGLFIFSMIMLWIVIFSLKENWTVKLIITPGQKINRSFIFRYFRHPNYFLNIIPELISISMICQSWLTLFIGLPVYLVPLTIRIIQEERVMKMHFSNY